MLFDGFLLYPNLIHDDYGRVFFCMKYPGALFTKRSYVVSKRRFALAILVLLHLTIWHVLTINKLALPICGMFQTGTAVDLSNAFASMYKAVWSNLAYDVSLIGVVFSSLLSLTGPMHEEILINGFAANWIIRRVSFIAAIFITPLVFAFSHLPAFGFGKHLWGLFFAGLSYLLVRVISGSVLWSIVSHCLINMLIFIPKWVITILYHMYALE